MARPNELRAGCALAIALGIGCNGILGIEEAELAQQGQTPATGYVETPERPTLRNPADQACAADAACRRCVDACTGNSDSVGKCLEDHDCRYALDGHRSCIRANGCSGDGDCAEELAEGSKLVSSVRIGACLVECAEACEGRSVVGMCELYCACMSTQCPESGISAASCVKECEALDSSMVWCRWLHCEFRTPATPQHCQHAVGVGACDGNLGASCPGKTRDGLPCNLASECCGGVCNGGNCGRPSGG